MGDLAVSWKKKGCGEKQKAMESLHKKETTPRKWEGAFSARWTMAAATAREGPFLRFPFPALLFVHSV